MVIRPGGQEAMVIGRAATFVLLAACVSSAPAWADAPWSTPPPAPPNGAALVRDATACCPLGLATLRFHVENDRFASAASGDDRWYTNGVALEFAHQPAWARAVGRWMPGSCAFPCERTGAGFVLGQLIFTPESIRETDVIEDDRPYAGYLYAGVFWQRANRSTLDHLQLDVGVVGPSSGAESAQNWYHDLIDTVKAEGWDNQLDDEPTIQLYARRKWRFGTNIGTSWRAEVIPQAGVALGTVYRGVDAGALVRFGLHLPDDFGPARLADPGTAVYVPPCRGLRAYAFGRATGRWVQHDIFLDGNTWKDSHSIGKEPLVGEFEAGLLIQYAWRTSSVELIWSKTIQTEAFDGQPESHEWGRVTLSASWRY